MTLKYFFYITHLYNCNLTYYFFAILKEDDDLTGIHSHLCSFAKLSNCVGIRIKETEGYSSSWGEVMYMKTKLDVPYFSVLQC